MVYVNWEPLTTLATDRHTPAKYNTLMPCRTGSFILLEVGDCVLRIAENGIENTISLDRGAAVGSKHRRRLL